jgi:hypothetical protein
MKKLLLIIILFASLGMKQAHAATGIFGYAPGLAGTSQGSLGNSYVYCASSSPAQSGTLTSISAIASSTPGSNLISWALYDDNGGTLPHNLLTSNSPSAQNPPTAKAWATSTALSYALTAGTVYWMCYWINGNSNYYYLGSASWWSKSIGSFDTWPATMSAGSFSTSRHIALYATYTIGSATPVVTTSKQELTVWGFLRVLGNLIIN